ncbi:MAG: ATP-dependent RNA helicase [Alkalispirochaeta sp.]
MNPSELPVYQQRDKILSALESHRVVVVESPTGSGKTTQLPVILHEAGYSSDRTIGVTQPRRIAAVSVSDFIAKQLDATIPGLVGYKMRFDDRTTNDTRIKVMTDGILLQEIKNDEYLHDYSVIMVDEAHERSLNIDFVLGLLKRALELRSDLRVIVSSATINADIFSQYFDSCPVVRIETQMYPVQVIYDDPKVQDLQEAAASGSGNRGRGGKGVTQRQARELAYDAIVDRVVNVVQRIVDEEHPGDILIFLSGEQMIKDTITRLYSLPIRRSLHILPLYGRLSKAEQDAVFPPPPQGKRKIVVATNIAETSITIDGITAVIDSGLSKTNFYNPRTYTSALVEGPISKASANQRKGRAGRTRPGRCYRLYGRRDFENRPLFQEDEIYRTDLSEVVLRMAELGIRDFEEFDFISSPGRGNILGAVETLRLLDAINDERELTAIGRMMAVFPLLPRHSRIIVEAIHSYPDVMEEILIAVSFLTSATPFVLPPGEEVEARKAHHRYRDDLGDFVSYLRLFAAYTDAPDKHRFCESRYLDPRTMGEIANVKQQLAEIVSEMEIPIVNGGSHADYLSAIARGLIQFVCVHTGKGIYQSLTAERIQIHPGSGLFRETPQFIVAGEIVRTSRTYARSVSPLQKEWLRAISPDLYEGLQQSRRSGQPPGKGGRAGDTAGGSREAKADDTRWQLQIGPRTFPMVPYKGKKKIVILPWEELAPLVTGGKRPAIPGNAGKLRGRITMGEYQLLNGERLSSVLKIAPLIGDRPEVLTDWPRKRSFSVKREFPELVRYLDIVLRPAPLKKNTSQLGFLALYSSDEGQYWFKPNRGFYNAVHESLASLEQLIDELDDAGHQTYQETVSTTYRRLSDILERD